MLPNTILKLCIVRHGQTYHNLSKTFAGQQPGKLTDLGIKEALTTGEFLKEHTFDIAYVSDLTRTRETF